MQSCLDKLNEMFDGGTDPFDIPPQWLKTHSEIIALDLELRLLGVPRFPVPREDDFLLEEALSWRKYLAHVAPLVRAGRLEEARRIVLKDAGDEQMT